MRPRSWQRAGCRRIGPDASGRGRPEGPGPRRRPAARGDARRRLSGLRRAGARRARRRRDDHPRARPRPRVPGGPGAYAKASVAGTSSSSSRPTGARPAGSSAPRCCSAAIIDRRTAGLADVVGAGGRTVRSKLKAARERPPCVVCSHGVTAAETALTRFAERAVDADWAAALAAAPLCAGRLPRAVDGRRIRRLRSSRSPVRSSRASSALHDRLEGFAHHSSHDRRHLLTDDERAAADEATRALGGTKRAEPN